MNSFGRFPALVFFVVAVAAGSSHAQQSNRNQVGLSIGGSDYHILDHHASPLIYSSFGFAANVAYAHDSEESSHSFDGSFDFNDLTTTSDNFHTRNWRVSARYSHVRSISTFSLFRHDFILSLGGSLASFFSKADYYYRLGSLDARTITSWYWSHSVDLAALIRYNIAPREFFRGRVSFPIISNVARPPFSSSGNYNYFENDWKINAFGDTRFFPQNMFINVSMAYQRPLFGDFNLQISYEFVTSSYDRPAEMKMYANSFCAGLFFSF